jgi:hypothetical protein
MLTKWFYPPRVAQGQGRRGCSCSPGAPDQARRSLVVSNREERKHRKKIENTKSRFQQRKQIKRDEGKRRGRPTALRRRRHLSHKNTPVKKAKEKMGKLSEKRKKSKKKARDGGVSGHFADRLSLHLWSHAWIKT